jgi:acetyltransferase-like isoleucine patch superfamily enzyme
VIAADVELGPDVSIPHRGLVNLSGCRIGANTRIGAFVEIQRGAVIGRNCKISSHTVVCAGVVIGDGVFIGDGGVFTNDRDPRAVNRDGSPRTDADWLLLETRVERCASIATGATILAGVTIGEGALVGAGAVVTTDVPAHSVVAGVPGVATGFGDSTVNTAGVPAVNTAGVPADRRIS